MNNQTPLLTRRAPYNDKLPTTNGPPKNKEHTLAKHATREVLYDGNGKTLYQTDRNDLLVMEFKGAPTDPKKKGKTKSIAALKNELSSYLFEYLEGYHIPTHFVKQLSETEMLVKRVDVIRIMARVYNVATGSIPKRFGFKEGAPLNFPIIEHFYKDEDQGTTWINEFHSLALNLVTPDEFRILNRVASKTNAVLRALCERRELTLASVALEFGKHKTQIVLCDELSPATCVFWRMNAPKAEREMYRPNTPNAEETLAELSNLIQRKG